MSKKQTFEVWVYVQDQGDGSQLPRFYQTEAQAEKVREYDENNSDHAGEICECELEFIDGELVLSDRAKLLLDRAEGKKEDEDDDDEDEEEDEDD